MKQFLVGIALAVAISMVSVVPALAKDTDPVTGLDKPDYSEALKHWGGYETGATLRGALVPERGPFDEKSFMWDPSYGAVRPDHEEG